MTIVTEHKYKVGDIVKCVLLNGACTIRSQIEKQGWPAYEVSIEYREGRTRNCWIYEKDILENPVVMNDQKGME